ncbi:hypothetical protein [uncultured Empedobacter sp.]|nr:hypothetical protein [uncultured Empedobacter sp.]
MSKIEQYTQQAINIANNNKHGYTKREVLGREFDAASSAVAIGFAYKF